MFLGHGIGTRSDLPLPASLAAIGAGTVVLISCGALAVLWRRPRLNRDAGISLPQVFIKLADASVTRILLRSGTLSLGRALGAVCHLLGGAGAGVLARRAGLAGAQSLAAGAHRADRDTPRRS